MHEPLACIPMDWWIRGKSSNFSGRWRIVKDFIAVVGGVEKVVRRADGRMWRKKARSKKRNRVVGSSGEEEAVGAGGGHKYCGEV